MRLLEMQIPVSFDQVVTKDYIEYLLKHGGTDMGLPFHTDTKDRPAGWNASEGAYRFVDDHWDEIVSQNPHLSDVDPNDDVMGLPEVRSFIQEWLPNRWAYMVDWMQKHMKIVGGELMVYRMVHINQKQANSIRLGNSKKLGSFWTYSNQGEFYSPWGEGSPDTTGVLFTALVDMNSVDWITTMRRNLDYELGEDESEIFIPAGEPITLLKMNVYDEVGKDWTTWFTQDILGRGYHA